jgi:biofilm PGA synthesis N-glycosyltransferase PgaC
MLRPFPRVIAVVPAHNEEEYIGDCLQSLLLQTRPPDRILVVLDNCTDETELRLWRYPVHAMETVGNTAKEAGALNQALPYCKDYDYILEVDADSVLDRHFLQRALLIMEEDPTIGGVSGREGLRPYHGLSLSQRLLLAVVRYQRYLWDTMRMERPQDTMVIVGPAGLLRTRAVLQIGGWDNDSLTEDNALSLDLRLAGWRTVLGVGCYVYSDTPLDLEGLWRQRVRWGRGFQDYFRRPWRKGTWRGKVLFLYQWFITAWVGMSAAVTAIHWQNLNPLWAIPIVLLYLDRLTRMRLFPERHLSDFLLALPIGEWALFIFTQAANLAAIAQFLLRKQRSW